MIAVLYHQKLHVRESLLKHSLIRKGDQWVRGDDPQAAYGLLERGFDDVGIGQAAFNRQSRFIDFPETGKFLAIGRVVELAIAGHAGREAGFARAHRIALAGDRKWRRSGTADVSR